MTTSEVHTAHCLMLECGDDGDLYSVYGTHVARVFGVDYPDRDSKQQAIKTAVNERPKLLERVRVLEEALRFYENPSAWYSAKRIDPEDRHVPDFYDELDFGNTARTALEE